MSGHRSFRVLRVYIVPRRPKRTWAFAARISLSAASRRCRSLGFHRLSQPVLCGLHRPQLRSLRLYCFLIVSHPVITGYTSGSFLQALRDLCRIRLPTRLPALAFSVMLASEVRAATFLRSGMLCLFRVVRHHDVSRGLTSAIRRVRFARRLHGIVSACSALP
jgi:hypothetical protein